MKDIIRNIFLFTILMLTTSLSFAQSGKVLYAVGRVCDTKTVPIEYAVVALVNEMNVQVKTILTDADGSFRLDGIIPGKYKFLITHVSYVRYKKDVDIYDNSDMGVITLKAESYSMKEVKILARAIQYGTDSYTISMQNNSITKGKSAYEVLRFLPYVTNKQGALQILGQNVSRVRINGVLISDMKELEAIQAEYLDKVEIVFVGRLDEFNTGSGGEINIQLNRPKQSGYFGSVSANSSINFKYGYTGENLNSSLSYGNPKLSIYNYLNLQDSENHVDYKNMITYKKVGETRNSITKSRSAVLLFSDRLSINYDFIKNHSLGVNIRYNKSKSSPVYSSWSELFNNTAIIRSGTLNHGDRWNDQYQTSLYYTWKLNNKGSMFKLTGDYLHYGTNTRTDYEYIYDSAQGDQNSDYAKNKIDNKVNMFFTKALFNIKTTQNSSLEFGANYNSNRTHQFLVYHELTKNSWIPDDNRSDNYKLTGDNYAGFIGFSSKIGSKVNYKLSTRFEHREMIYNSRQMGLENKKSYNNLSVLANFIYFLNRDEGDLFHCIYERSCYSIPYSAISPIVTYINEHSYTKGNLNLEPSVSNEWWLILSLKNKWEFAFRIFTDKDNIYYKTFLDDQNNLVSYTMPVNGLSSLNFRLTAERSLKITDWWQMEVSGLLEWYKMNSSEDISRTLVSIVTMDNSLDFKNDLGGMMNFFWKSRSKQLERNYGQGGSIEMSIYKYLFNRKLQITLAAKVYQHERWVTRHTNEMFSKQYPRTAYSGISVRISYNFESGKKVKIKTNDNVQTYEEMNDDD